VHFLIEDVKSVRVSFFLEHLIHWSQMPFMLFPVTSVGLWPLSVWIKPCPNNSLAVITEWWLCSVIITMFSLIIPMPFSNNIYDHPNSRRGLMFRLFFHAGVITSLYISIDCFAAWSVNKAWLSMCCEQMSVVSYIHCTSRWPRVWWPVNNAWVQFISCQSLDWAGFNVPLNTL